MSNYGTSMDECWNSWLVMLDGDAYQTERQNLNKDMHMETRRQENTYYEDHKRTHLLVHNFYLVEKGKPLHYLDHGH